MHLPLMDHGHTGIQPAHLEALHLDVDGVDDLLQLRHLAPRLAQLPRQLLHLPAPLRRLRARSPACTRTPCQR